MLRFLFIVICLLFTCLSPWKPFTLNAQNWIQQGDDIDGEAAEDLSGWAMSLSSDGNTVAIGAAHNDGAGSEAGHVRVYEWDGVSWVQKGADIDGEAAGDWSGYSVSLSSDGNIVAMGEIFNQGNNDGSGQTRVFKWDGAGWVQMGADINGDPHDLSGTSVSLSSDGMTLAIGSEVHDFMTGCVRIFEWSGAAWVQKGQDIKGVGTTLDFFGHSISMSTDGNTIAIGAPMFSGSGEPGYVEIYKWDGSVWIQKGSTINGQAPDDHCGGSVSLSADGNTVAMGSSLHSGTALYAGHARVFEWDGTMWNQKGNNIDGESAGDSSGAVVALSADGNTLAIGAPRNSGMGIPDVGHVRIYQWDGNAWVQSGNDIDGEAEDDASGMGLYISSDGSTVAIGAPFNDGGGTDAGHVRVCRNKSVGLAKMDEELPFVVSPNPTRGSLMVEYPGDFDQITITVSNALGEVVTKRQFSQSETLQVDISGNPGIYWIDVLTGHNHSFTIPVVKL